MSKKDKSTAVCISVGSHFFAVSQPVRLNYITFFTSNISSLVCFQIKRNWLSLQQLANRNLQGSKEDYVLDRRMLVIFVRHFVCQELTGIVDLQIWKRAYSIYGSNRGKTKTTFCVC